MQSFKVNHTVSLVPRISLWHCRAMEMEEEGNHELEYESNLQQLLLFQFTEFMFLILPNSIAYLVVILLYSAATWCAAYNRVVGMIKAPLL